MQYLIPSNIVHEKSPTLKSYVLSKIVISILQNLPNRLLDNQTLIMFGNSAQHKSSYSLKKLFSLRCFSIYCDFAQFFHEATRLKKL